MAEFQDFLQQWQEARRNRPQRKAEVFALFRGYQASVLTPVVLLNQLPQTAFSVQLPSYESLARSLLPVIQKYYESDEGKRTFAEWKEKKEAAAKDST
ncbi:MAG: hypothetical protein KH352_05125 [Ruminococcus sp.]|nr:hypothetical protein [Candidatus Apopatosoma intestinale]